MNTNLILRTLNSPFSSPFGDFTKSSVLSHADVDNNFIYLKGNIIYTAQTSGNVLTLKKLNGDDIQINGVVDTKVTGFTYNNNNNGFSITNSDNSIYNAFINTMTGLTINGDLKSSTISATTYFNLPIDIYTTGFTFNPSNYNLTITRNDNTSLITNLAILASDVTVTGGTYNNNTGIVTFTNNTGGTFSVTGFVTGATYWVSGLTGAFSLKTINDSGLDATGNYSLAEGSGTFASGNASHAEGSGTTASGNYSHAEGFKTLATGQTSHAEGIQTRAYGNSSHAEGQQTTAIGLYGHSEGRLSIANGSNSHAEGFTTIANGSISHTEGSRTQALGNISHAEGSFTIASGQISHSEGQNTIASGDTSHAEGFNTTAFGTNSHAEGYFTTTFGNSSHAGGDTTIASGNTSFVHGSGSTANGTNTIVLGANITGNTDNTVYVSQLNIQIITTGTSINNLGIDINGNVVVGTSGSTCTNVTGGTYSNGTAVFTNNTGGTFNVTGFTTGGTSANLWSASTGVNSIIANNGSGNIANGIQSVVFGNNNIINQTANHAFIGGGINNGISGGTTNDMVIIGGNGNKIISSLGNRDGILGGFNNTISGSGSNNSVIIGGTVNNINQGKQNIIIGGENNSITGNTGLDSVIIGGNSNIINGISRSIILGGSGLTATDNDTTYVPHLNINMISSGISVSNLSVDISGNVISGTSNSPITVSYNDLTGQTTAISNITSYTASTIGTYRVGGYLNVTAIATDVIQLQVTYTDENGIIQTENFVSNAISTSISTVGNNPMFAMDIRVNSGSTITIKTILTTSIGSITYDVGGNIIKLY